MAYPSWFTLFTNYLDRKHKGFEYAIYSTSIGIGGALAAYFGATIANMVGFKSLFFVVGSVALLGFLLLIVLDRVEARKR
jgi:MFS family permease